MKLRYILILNDIKHTRYTRFVCNSQLTDATARPLCSRRSLYHNRSSRLVTQDPLKLRSKRSFADRPPLQLLEPCNWNCIRVESRCDTCKCCEHRREPPVTIVKRLDFANLHSVNIRPICCDKLLVNCSVHFFSFSPVREIIFKTHFESQWI